MSRLFVEARLHRLVGRSTSIREVVWVRHYARVETAMQRGLDFLMFSGQAGDLIEITLKVNGAQVGTMRRKASSTIESIWNDKEANRLRNRTLMAKSDRNSLVNYKSPKEVRIH